MNRSNPEPDAQALIRHRFDLNNARNVLQARWAFRSSNPLVAALEANRSAALAILQASDQLITSLLQPTEPHNCDRPEDCAHPDCRAQVDSWQADNYHLLTRDPADHPKANPLPSERELAHAWNC